MENIYEAVRVNLKPATFTMEFDKKSVIIRCFAYPDSSPQTAIPRQHNSPKYYSPQEQFRENENSRKSNSPQLRTCKCNLSLTSLVFQLHIPLPKKRMIFKS